MSDRSYLPGWDSMIQPCDAEIQPVLRDFIVIDISRTCCMCYVRTHWIEMNFQVPVHPETCIDVLWNDYHDALRKQPDPEDPSRPYGLSLSHVSRETEA